ncbi:hypothetical protein [Acidithiobacillus sulfuriphilus]|uniref:Uncharacterized protein n=1 Tax=Acidithiobacillus sulfuriphilus TaxID=1867749 RepID=A0ACD5HQQ9_9PROT|nr:hypothetical protein [Acidithiobacillus sulfuriphilus]
MEGNNHADIDRLWSRTISASSEKYNHLKATTVFIGTGNLGKCSLSALQGRTNNLFNQMVMNNPAKMPGIAIGDSGIASPCIGAIQRLSPWGLFRRLVHGFLAPNHTELSG